MPPISASEAISPALERTKQICFRPFKFGRWLKLAVVTLFTGEVATTSCNFGVPNNTSGGTAGPVYTPPSGMGDIMGALHAIPVILLALAFIALIGVFVLVMSYLWCQFRLTLIDTVLTGECRIRESWDKYGSAGIRLFVFFLLSGIIFGILALVIFLAILIPTIVIAVAIGVTFKGQFQALGSFFSAMTAAKLAFIATVAIVCIGVFAYLLAFISVPAAIFFESYALYFLGSRYEPLRVLLIPEPSPAPYPIIPPHAPPDFIPPHPGPETA